MRVIGIDGGGTRTRAILVSIQGEIAGLGQSGPSNPLTVGWKSAEEAIGEAIAMAWEDCGEIQKPVDAAFLGIAGITREKSAKRFALLGERFALPPSDRLGVDHDLRIALTGALGGRPGIILVAGTGSAAYGRLHCGRDGIAGGLGWKMDDPGSAFWLGKEALRAVARARDGRGEKTALTDCLKHALQIDSMAFLTERLYAGSGLSPLEIASMAPQVMALAESGDPVARSLVEEGCGELALMALAVARNLDLAKGPLDIAAAGGVSRSGPFFLSLLKKTIRHLLPEAKLVEALLPPVSGAALLALNSIGFKNSGPLLQKLRTQSIELGLL